MAPTSSTGSIGAAQKKKRIVPEVSRILLVDANQVSQIMGQVVLEQHGYECVALGDGIAAVDNIESQLRAGKPYQLILTAVDVPGRDAFDLTSEIRRIESALGWYRTPVVVMSTDPASDMEACMDAGVDGIFPFPISMTTTLVSTIFQYPADGQPEKEALTAPGSVAIAYMIRHHSD